MQCEKEITDKFSYAVKAFSTQTLNYEVEGYICEACKKEASSQIKLDVLRDIFDEEMYGMRELTPQWESDVIEENERLYA